LIEETLKTTLDTLGYKVFPLKKPQDTALPCLVYTKIANPRRKTHSGKVNLKKARFQIDVYSSTYSEVKTITKLVEDLLECNTTPWTLSQLIDARDLTEENSYRVLIESYLFYEEI